MRVLDFFFFFFYLPFSFFSTPFHLLTLSLPYSSVLFTLLTPFLAYVTRISHIDTINMSEQSSDYKAVPVHSTASTTVASEVQSAGEKGEAAGAQVNGVAKPESSDSSKEQAKEEPTKETTTAASGKKPDYLAKNPALTNLYEKLPSILSATGHREMFGVPLKEDYRDIPTINILIKFLRANDGNVKEAEEQLRKALEWRKKMDPAALLEKGSYNPAKFDGLGYMTKYKTGDDKEDVIITWNIYGGVKDMDYTFGDVDE